MPIPTLIADAQCKAREETVFLPPGNRKTRFRVRNSAGKICSLSLRDAGKAAELLWPAAHSGAVLQWGSAPYSGGGETQINFARGNSRYVHQSISGNIRAVKIKQIGRQANKRPAFPKKPALIKRLKCGCRLPGQHKSARHGKS